VISPADYLNNLNSHVIYDVTLLLIKHTGSG
jgi:hypothetical protein